MHVALLAAALMLAGCDAVRAAIAAVSRQP
jgi:uncharacterized lipoprotein YajG